MLLPWQSHQIRWGEVSRYKYAKFIKWRRWRLIDSGHTFEAAGRTSDAMNCVNK